MNQTRVFESVYLLSINFVLSVCFCCFTRSSFAPILKLISGCDITAVHHWATWALANLCNVDGKLVSLWNSCYSRPSVSLATRRFRSSHCQWRQLSVKKRSSRISSFRQSDWLSAQSLHKMQYAITSLFGEEIGKLFFSFFKPAIHLAILYVRHGDWRKTRGVPTTATAIFTGDFDSRDDQIRAIKCAGDSAKITSNRLVCPLLQVTPKLANSRSRSILPRRAYKFARYDGVLRFYLFFSG